MIDGVCAVCRKPAEHFCFEWRFCNSCYWEVQAFVVPLEQVIIRSAVKGWLEFRLFKADRESNALER